MEADREETRGRSDDRHLPPGLRRQPRATRVWSTPCDHRNPRACRPRVTELCQLDNQDIDVGKARFHDADAKTEAGTRSVDIHPRLLDELTRYSKHCGPGAMDRPAFPTRTGSRRDKDNVRTHVVAPAAARASELRAARGEPSIRTHVTPHTFRRTYITFLIAAGYDLPYVQAQVGHVNPAITLSIYAQVMRRADRDQLVRAEMRDLLGTSSAPTTDRPASVVMAHALKADTSVARLRGAETARKGRRLIS